MKVKRGQLITTDVIMWAAIMLVSFVVFSRTSGLRNDSVDFEKANIDSIELAELVQDACNTAPDGTFSAIYLPKTLNGTAVLERDRVCVSNGRLNACSLFFCQPVELSSVPLGEASVLRVEKAEVVRMR